MYCLDILKPQLSFFVCTNNLNFWFNYHCSFGPEDKRGNLSAKRRTSFVQKRGCQCHFIMKVMHEIPDKAILTFNMYGHEDGEG